MRYLCRCRAFALPMLCLCSAFAVPLRYLCPTFAVPLRCLCSTIRRRPSFGRSEDGRRQSVYCTCSPHVSWSRVVSGHRGHRGHLPLPTTLNHSTTQPKHTFVIAIFMRTQDLAPAYRTDRARSFRRCCCCCRHLPCSPPSLHMYRIIPTAYAQPAA